MRGHRLVSCSSGAPRAAAGVLQCGITTPSRRRPRLAAGSRPRSATPRIASPAPSPLRRTARGSARSLSSSIVSGFWTWRTSARSPRGAPSCWPRDRGRRWSRRSRGWPVRTGKRLRPRSGRMIRWLSGPSRTRRASGRRWRRSWRRRSEHERERLGRGDVGGAPASRARPEAAGLGGCWRSGGSGRGRRGG
ncbi:hypothetical protein Y09_0731 [Brachybacterium sp. SW0106-09]|nr:hypothetical protein Y09_0731 [Brachybacterium sp. SW0106-09]